MDAAAGAATAAQAFTAAVSFSKLFSSRPVAAPFASLSPANHSSSPSPFTERHSVKPLRGGGKINELSCIHPIVASHEGPQNNHDGIFDHQEEEHDIASRLPELKELLNLLRKDEKTRLKDSNGSKVGNVFLVGTGPGDPDLLTVKALKLMQTADLVLYDRLVSTDILDLVHDGARLLYVGKTAGYHSRTQDEIHQLLLSFAETGATVLRLKGGDPLVFGRGGEEMDFLQQQGIHVRVVPGITSASGIAAELGIPLTHRGAATSVRFLTGHSRKGGTDPLFVVEKAADPESTLVVYMGLSTLPSLASKLIESGLPPDTPAAAVERGTTIYQRMVFGNLKELPSKVAEANLVSPTLIYIGRVVALSPYWSNQVIEDAALTF